MDMVPLHPPKIGETPGPKHSAQKNPEHSVALIEYCFVIYVLAAILLGHLKKDAGDVKRALLSLDEGLLTPECLKQLIDFAPDENEVSSLFLSRKDVHLL